MIKKMDESPIHLDIKDLERDIVLLERTNDELKTLIDGMEDEVEKQELRVVIVENEFAIDQKLQRRHALRESISLSLSQDVFLLSRKRQSNSEPSNNAEPSRRAVLVSTDDTVGIVL
jgi:hypothetical protein